MTSFKVLDRRLREDTKALHDWLWRGWKGDEAGLLRDLARDATDLDAFLGAGGGLRRPARALIAAVRARGREGPGAGLFELLSHVHDLTAATEHARSGDFAGAGDHLEDAIGSVTIGTCAAAGRFPYVQQWEGGAIDFDAYMGKLADVLEEKGVARAGEWKRIASGAYHLKGTLNPRAPEAERALLARAAVTGACWATLANVAIRRALGSRPRVPYADFAHVIRRIADRL
jgi:hypothetical protein